MTKPQQRWLVEALNAVTDKIKDEPGFMDDEELKAMYVVLHTATAAVMFDETRALAETCANFCEDKAFEVGDSN